MATDRVETAAELERAAPQLDEAMAQLRQPGLVRQWHFWHGPAGVMSEEQALHGDLSGWQEVTLPVGWSTADGDTWLRTSLAYPEAVEGISTAGVSAEMVLILPVCSHVYVNGQIAAQADWWLDGRVSPIPLAERVEPGKRIEIACFVPQGDGLGGLGRVAVQYQRVQAMLLELELLRAQLSFSYALARRSGDTARLEAWQQAVARLPWAHLQARRWDDWRSGAAQVIEALAVLTPEAKEYIVYAAAHAHIDMNWLWPWEDTVDVVRRDFRTMDELMARYPQFHFSQSQASTYWAMEQHDPEVLARVRERVREGRWEVTANTWVENDLNMSSGEATAHHFLYTRRYMQQLFGVTSRVVWEPDTFGHPATMPQIARKGGGEYYYFCRGGPRYPLFWWEGLDGTRLLAFQDLHWYLGELLPRVVADSAIELAEQYDLKSSLVVYGAGDHGGGATARDIEVALLIDRAPCMPSVRLSPVEAFFDAVHEAAPELPVFKGEMNPVFAGCYTSHADIKRLNRTGETALLDAETTATVAALLADAPYPRAEMEQNWRDILFQQFHDILCGCGIGLTSLTAHRWAEPAIARTREITRRALDALVARLDLGQDTRPSLLVRPCWVVYNSLPWTRGDLVRLPVEWECAWVVDDQGRAIPAQRAGVELLFMAEDVPALGFRVYRPGDMSPLPDDAQVVHSPAYLTLENEYLRFTVDARSGAISHLYDKEAKRDLTLHARGDPGAELDTRGVLNRMQIWWEQPHGMSAWKIGDISRVDHLVAGAEVRLVESGPVRGTIEVQRRFLNSRLVQHIRLYRDSRRIDFETEVEWHEKGSATSDAPMLRVCFEPSLGQTEANFQVPFGVLRRPADGQEVVAQMWADLSETDGRGYGVSLLNNCKYGYQAHGNSLGLTLIRASYEPDRNPDEGMHTFTYSFYPHLGSWREAAVERRAQELNRPLMAVATSPTVQSTASASLRPGVSLLRCQPENVSVSAFKYAEAGDGLILRLVETHGVAVTAEISLAAPVAAAREVSLAEEPLPAADDSVRLVDGSVQVEMKPHEIKTIHLRLA